MSMLSMRLKMKGENVDLSPQYSVDCNYYNQGCDGGYPFLVEKFFTENYLVSENDYPYTAKTGRCQNVNLDNAEQLYQIKNYRYIGGAYGLSNEQDIMEEIYNNGPVILNFEPEYDFMSYGGGVYHSTDAADWKRNGYSQPEWVTN
jgi:cathepsin C